MKLTKRAVLGSLLMGAPLAPAIAILTATPIAQAAASPTHVGVVCAKKVGKGTTVPAPGRHGGHDYLVDARMGWAI
jgi:hypothetical protein